MNEREREFRLRPGKPRVSKSQSEGVAWTSGFKMLMHYARQSRGASRQGSQGGNRGFPHRQRCAVRITYSKNTVRGQWRAHGRYLERESASGGGSGFDARETELNVSTRLQGWQARKDELLWKLIISPEFGDRIDLQLLTRNVMSRVAVDVGGPLEWVAVAHHNTEHPHVHVALRGVIGDGAALRLKRDYVKNGIREIAEDVCTRQLGFRTTLDAQEASRREVNENRFTSLDRAILRNARASDSGLVFTHSPARSHQVTARLIALSRMGLAESADDGTWRLRPDMEQVLRAMQRAGDRQKTLFAHGELVSDMRLPVEVINWSQMASVEGRVLMHGEDEHSGKSFLMLESTSARVHFIPYTQEMDEIRARGGLKTNSFIRMRTQTDDGRLRIEIADFGQAEVLLTNRQLLRETFEELRRHGRRPTEDGWGGWLGRYQKALCEMETDRAFVNRDQRIDKEARRRPRSLER
jgi:hypothetical protein